MGVAISASEFRDQLSIIARHYCPVTAADVRAFLAGGRRLPDNAALITFDDGLRNNFTWAAPILEQLGIPAVFFVTTGLVGTTSLLWTHELYERIMAWRHDELPLPDNAGPVAAPSTRKGKADLAEQIKRLCKQIPDELRNSYLEGLREEPLKLTSDWHRELYEIMSWDEVRQLANRGFEIGSHTVNHPILTRLRGEDLVYELCQSKARIEKELGRPCGSVAYPNGGPADVNATVIQATAEAGYALGFTLSGRVNPLHLAPLEIGRVCMVPGLSGNALLTRSSGLADLVGRA